MHIVISLILLVFLFSTKGKSMICVMLLSTLIMLKISVAKSNFVMFVFQKDARKENMDKDATLLADTVKTRTLATIQTGLV